MFTSVKSKRYIHVGLIVSALLGGVAEANATAEDVHEIIDICTSSERIMKDYALIGMRIVYHDPKHDMDETLRHLDEEMSRLESHPLSKKLHEEELSLQHGWDDIVKHLSQKPTKESALSLHHQIDKFAMACEKVANDLAQDTGNEAESGVVHIAKLDLDVQELAGNYVMKAWDAMSDDEYYRDVAQIKADYQKSMRLWRMQERVWYQQKSNHTSDH